MTTLDTIAHYRITAKLGAGGMGEVYRATDTKLGRDVALKVIPDKFAQDVVRMSRFRREAQVLASLNHPNIAAIYGVEDRALVMELVEGATLAERISSDPIALEEAMPIARQIADALEYAHEHGVIHRDLKPANIKITPEGRVKVLDFGLAKALTNDGARRDDPEIGPTVTLSTASEGGVIGTAAYMSPEQARGKTVDKRGDIWAFGVVLLQMLTGRAVFKGETVSDTLAAVLRSDIDFTHLPRETPPAVRYLLERCLTRDPARRLRDIGEARILMDSVHAPAFTAETSMGRKKWLPWGAAIASATLAACIASYRYPTYSPEPVRFEIYPPPGAAAFFPSVSPDGRSVAFVGGTGSGNLNLYIRRLDQLETNPVPNSDAGNSRPFWSSDSRRLGFFAAGKLNTVTVDGGAVQTLIDGMVSNTNSYSAAWSSTGTILFTQEGKPIYRIPESGGVPAPVLSFDKSRGETAQLIGGFLPDGKHFLYTSISRERVDVYEGSLDASKPIRVLDSTAVLGFARPAHARTGYMLLYSGGQILLRPFDPGTGRVSGNPVLVQSGVLTSVTSSPNASAFTATTRAGSISGGTLVYATSWRASSQITWISRQGQTLQTVGDPSLFGDPSISPDERYVTYSRGDSKVDIWLADIRHGGATRLTFDEGAVYTPIFSPDGSQIAYSSETNGESTVFIRAANGTGTRQKLFNTKSELRPVSWSRDSRWLACIIGVPGSWDIDLVPVSPGRKPLTLVNTPFDEYQPQFSPDGRWIAYTANEGGRYEVYVVNVPLAAGGSAAVQGRWQISTAGGQQPRWRGDGKELFFLSEQGHMMSVRIDSSANRFQASAPESLFPTGATPRGPQYVYDVTADGRKFVLLKPVSGLAPPLKVVVNWASAFGAR